MEKVYRRLKHYLENPLCSPHCYVSSCSYLLRVYRAETRRGSGSSSRYMQRSWTLDDKSDTTWARTNVGEDERGQNNPDMAGMGDPLGITDTFTPTEDTFAAIHNRGGIFGEDGGRNLPAGGRRQDDFGF